jgi:hypothetical protein
MSRFPSGSVLGLTDSGTPVYQAWWAREDLNLGPLPCQGSALTPELRALASHSDSTVPSPYRQEFGQ